MSCFSISFLSKPLSDSDRKRAEGIGEGAYAEIVLGNYRERIIVPLPYWDKARYEAQWREALERILVQETSSLVVSIVNPEKSSYLFWWPMYRNNAEILVQNHLLFFHQLPEPFNLANLYSYIPNRRTHSEEGEPISTWTIHAGDVRAFLKRLP